MGPILVVDDDPAIRTTVAEMLEFEDFDVRTACNGREALDSLEDETPSVVLLDMRMPVMDGWGFARELRERGVELPIVVMTAAQSAEQWCREIGAEACLSKPFDMDQLLDTVERVQQEQS